MNAPVAGRVFVLFGGTSGIGAAAAEAFCAAGAHCVLVGREDSHAETCRSRWGGQFPLLTGDAADPDLAQRAVDAAVREWGRLDGLFHVAGGSGRRHGDGPADLMTDEGWRQTLALNLDSMAWSNRAAIRHFMTQGKGGVLLNLGSVLARHPSPDHFATHAYAAAKSGMEGWTRAVASHYARAGIRANLLAAGLCDTPMARRALDDFTIREFARHKQPLSRDGFLQPTDLVGAILFLLSEASSMMTGQVIELDGGWSVSEGRNTL